MTHELGSISSSKERGAPRNTCSYFSFATNFLIPSIQKLDGIRELAKEKRDCFSQGRLYLGEGQQGSHQADYFTIVDPDIPD